MNRYGHLYPGKDAEVADKLDKLFTAQPAPVADVRMLGQRP